MIWHGVAAGARRQRLVPVGDDYSIHTVLELVFQI
jgi:hypothetical protein